MRSISHWTPRYIKDRVELYLYEKRYPEHPWLTRSANEFLSAYLMKSDIGLEFGSGRSTLWIAQRIKHLISVEDNVVWAARVQDMLAKDDIENVEYKVFPTDMAGQQISDTAYVKIIDSISSGSLDFCLVDGAYRDYCTLGALDKIRPGGILVIDNVNRYLPSNSLAPFSRTLADGPSGPIWEKVEQRISCWRKLWTSSGVSDTAIFFKPCP